MRLKKIWSLIILATLCSSLFIPSLIKADDSTYALGELVINVRDSNDNSGVEGAYFTVTSTVQPNRSYLLKTDSLGQASANLPQGVYILKQVGTTDKLENYSFTSIGYSIRIDSGKLSINSTQQKISGDYVFKDSPTEMHIPQNSSFNFDSKVQGIQAYKLNMFGELGEKIPNSQIYAYYNNVDVSTPGEYVAFYMTLQKSLNIKTTHLLKVIVDPDLPKKGGDVTATYVDTTGKPISDPVVKSGNVGDAYETEQKTIPGYTFKAVTGNPNGQLTDQPQQVVYTYSKNPVPGGDVTAIYVDTTGKPISDPVVKSGNVGDPYTTEQKIIPDYTFKFVTGNPNGQLTDQPQHVIYTYSKNAGPGEDPVAPNSNTPSQPQNSQNPSSSSPNSVQNELPQTGETDGENIIIAILGLMIMGTATLILSRDNKNHS